MTNKKQYLRPRALNISGLGVLGYEPLGVCATGHDPTTVTCSYGEDPAQNPAACNPAGYSPNSGDCVGGGQVANICGIGSLHS